MTTMNITVVANDKKSATSAAGKPYQLYEVAYRNNSFQDKLESAKINQYSGVFSKVAGMKPGEAYIITKEKNDGGFWQWEDVVALPPGEGFTSATPPTASGSRGETSKTFTPVKSTYETPEERAKKQVYIVKQSSLSAAVEVFKHNNPKGAINPDDVITMAQGFVDWVFETPKLQAAESLANMSDDFPD
jgi:hypothetical protein